MKRLVLVGGGHAHLFVLERLARERPVGVEATLVTPCPKQLYSGMVPGWIAGDYALDACAVPLERLAARAGVHFVGQCCEDIDLAAGTVRCGDGRRLPFDWLSLDAGSATATHAIEGAQRYAASVRPIERFVEIVARLLGEARAGRAGDIVVIGGGAAAVEIAFALDARLADLGWRGAGGAAITVVGAEPQPLAGLPRLARWRAGRLMRERGIGWVGGQRVSAVDAHGAVLADGTALAARHVLLATGPAAHPWLAASGLATDAHGFVRVGATLQSLSHPQVFAVGDCAAYPEPRPKSGVFAVRAGPPLATNLLRAVAGEPLLGWRPQRRALYLLNTGDGRALAAWGPFAWRGRWVRRWKDRIDRAFVARFDPREGA